MGPLLRATAPHAGMHCRAGGAGTAHGGGQATAGRMSQSHPRQERGDQGARTKVLVLQGKEASLRRTAPRRTLGRAAVRAFCMRGAIPGRVGRRVPACAVHAYPGGPGDVGGVGGRHSDYTCALQRQGACIYTRSNVGAPLGIGGWYAERIRCRASTAFHKSRPDATWTVRQPSAARVAVPALQSLHQDTASRMTFRVLLYAAILAAVPS